MCWDAGDGDVSDATEDAEMTESFCHLVFEAALAVGTVPAVLEMPFEVFVVEEDAEFFELMIVLEDLAQLYENVEISGPRDFEQVLMHDGMSVSRNCDGGDVLENFLSDDIFDGLEIEQTMVEGDGFGLEVVGCF